MNGRREIKSLQRLTHAKVYQNTRFEINKNLTIHGLDSNPEISLPDKTQNYFSESKL
jgi:hypothetical protein